MRLALDLALVVDGRFEKGLAVSIADGRIGEIVRLVPAETDAPDLVRLPGKALLLGTINTHCHTFQSLLRGLGDDLDFMQWRDRVLYPYSVRLDREGMYLGAAFAEMLIQRATTCADFFYLQDDDEELALMAERGAGLAYCPSSNMILGDGITRITEMKDLGILIGLGTDGGCTNNRLSVVRNQRLTTVDQAELMERVRALTRDWALA